MDAYEATRVVFSRIQALDPDHAAKIMGFLLLQDHGDKEMIRLALAPDSLLHSIVLNARKDLAFLPPPPPPSPPSSSAAAAAAFLLPDEPFGLAAAGELPWRPCLYYARGFCKNGTCCKFQHGLMEKNHIFSPTSPLSPSRSALEALFMGGGGAGDEAYKFASRYAAMASPSARQIYLTFPADSTFKEEDVSNYFSMYGPVQDVRIPYQQKRMFGFVTFVYPETVRLILAKGNPHFVCDARVLVKPYKEKGKVPDKYRNSSSSYSSALELRDAYELQQLGAREMLLRRRMEEQQQAMELQQAIELQRRQFMGLKLHDIRTRSSNSSSNGGSQEDGSSPQDKSLSPQSSAATAAIAAASAATELVHQRAVKVDGNKEVVGGLEGSPKEDGDFQKSRDEHNLPDSPFASPTKACSFLEDDLLLSVSEAEAAAPSSSSSSSSPFSSNHFSPYLLQIPSWNVKAVEN